MQFCPNCGEKLPSDSNFCTSCGTNLDRFQNKSAIREQRRRQRSKKIESQDESINVFYRLAFTRKHMLQVLNFMENNALTLLILATLMIIPWDSNWVRVTLFLIYIVMIYMYPLLSSQKRFKWDKSLEKWLNDENNISNLKSSAKHVVGQVQDEINSKIQESKEKQVRQTVTFVPEQTEDQMQTKTHHGFKNNKELDLGIILAVIGGLLYFNEKSQITNVSTQVMSVLQNGGLSDAGYGVIWGAVGLGIGIFAMIGGFLKAMSGKSNGGGMMKGFGVIIVLIAGCLASYAYSNPISTVEGAINSGVNLSNIQTIIQMIKIIPWVAGISYTIGIILNIGGRKAN